MNIPKIVICTASYGPWIPDFRRFFLPWMIQLVRRHTKAGTAEIGYIDGCDTYQAMARETVSQKALDAGADYLFWIDTDMILPENALERLLAHNKQMVSGAYWQRQGNHQRVAYYWNDDPKNPSACGNALVVSIADDIPKNLIEVGAVGFGCVLIHRSVFEVIPKPWFVIEKDKTSLLFGEDIHFCVQCYKMGVLVYLDASLEVGHLSNHNIVINSQNCAQLRKEKEIENCRNLAL